MIQKFAIKSFMNEKRIWVQLFYVVNNRVNLAGRDFLEELGFQLRRFSSSNTSDDKVNIDSIEECCQPRRGEESPSKEEKRRRS